MPTDTPSPLAAAAEALCHWSAQAVDLLSTVKPLEEPAVTGWVMRETTDAVNTLRAALAADAAWRARAEAALGMLDAQEAATRFACAEAAPDEAGLAAQAQRYTELLQAVVDARRRYEETCRAG